MMNANHHLNDESIDKKIIRIEIEKKMPYFSDLKSNTSNLK
jgi:hypothetical protein